MEGNVGEPRPATDDTRTPKTQAGRDLLADPGYWPRGPKLATILAIEAEARDATGLERAARDLLAAWPNIVNHPRLDNVEVAALRAALAASSPEPRWPSRDELAKALIDSEMMSRLNAYAVAANPDSMMLESFDVLAKSWADAILAALREGGARP